MKKYIIALISTLGFSVNTVFAQDIPSTQVPSVVLNSFQKQFPKAFDIEWEMDGNLYKVEFETGIPKKDHEIWYDSLGRQIRHREEISKSDLPKSVVERINKDFFSYRIDEIKKITEEGKITYVVDLENLKEELKVTFDAQGTVLSQMAD